MEQNMNEIIKNYEQSQIQQILKNSKVTDFAPGDTVKVNVKIKEGNKERVQAFQGVCIGKKNNGLNSSFTVRKISSGEGVERVFPLYSNVIESIERIKVGDVRRAKLYYLRELSGKKARIAKELMVVPMMMNNTFLLSKMLRLRQKSNQLKRLQ